jgi:uncharacterized protein YbjQ (UPF0145 family)
MNHSRFLATVVVAISLSAPAMARDTHHMFPLEDALNTEEAKEKLDPEIKLYFGKQKHPRIGKELGEWRTSKKTNAFGKEDKVACEWAFLSAALEMQERARKEGGNAVVNIKSNYRNMEKASETEYECGAGALMAGVALKGTVVKLAQ